MSEQIPSWEDMFHRERTAVERLMKENQELRDEITKWMPFIRREMMTQRLLEDTIAKVKRQEAK